MFSWYYPFMEKDTHYLEFDDPNDIEWLIQTPDYICENIIKRANKFAAEYLGVQTHLDYMSRVMLNISQKSSTSI